MKQVTLGDIKSATMPQVIRAGSDSEGYWKEIGEFIHDFRMAVKSFHMNCFDRIKIEMLVRFPLAGTEADMEAAIREHVKMINDKSKVIKIIPLDVSEYKYRVTAHLNPYDTFYMTSWNFFLAA